jgi:hypothetical protein
MPINQFEVRKVIIHDANGNVFKCEVGTFHYKDMLNPAFDESAAGTKGAGPRWVPDPATKLLGIRIYIAEGRAAQVTFTFADGSQALRQNFTYLQWWYKEGE